MFLDGYKIITNVFFHRFIESDEKVLICTHATLRFAFEGLDESLFNDTLLVIDEFHHVSADTENNILGDVLRTIMAKSSAHIIAMTGSYFRGDSEGLFDLKHVPADDERASADFVARRKPCKYFEKYESLFKEVHKEFVDGKRKLIDFNYESLREGEHYINNGILLYLEKVNFDKRLHKI